MEKSEQRVVIKFLWIKWLGARCIHIQLSGNLGDDRSSPAAIECWLARFREGDLSYPDHSRSDRPEIDFSECWRAYPDKFPFTSANMMSRHFRIARGTIMEILQRDLGLKNFSHRWVGNHFNSSQKADRVSRCRVPVHLLQQLQPFDFERITIREESWFMYEYESDSLFAPSAYMVLPRLRAGFQAKKTMIIVFFIATRLIQGVPPGHEHLNIVRIKLHSSLTFI
jgi:hypothetical protein